MTKSERRYATARDAVARSRRTGHFDLRDLESNPFAEHVIPVPLRSELEANWLSGLKLTGYQRKGQISAQREVALQCLYNLILAGLPGGAVSDTRNTSTAAVRRRISVWDAIEAAGWLAGKVQGQRRRGKGDAVSSH